MRRLRALWRWSWLITVPLTGLFAAWIALTWSQWHRLAVDYEAGHTTMTLRDAGIAVWSHAARSVRIELDGTDLRDVPKADQLRSVQLQVDEHALARLDDDLPYSGQEFVDGYLTYPEGRRMVKLRYRGDSPLHWAHAKKSLRIKTKPTDLFEGMRVFDLVVPRFPEQLNNYLGYALAKELDLIAPRCELVNVFLNGRNLGVHQFTEQLEEGTLRRHDRMPGDLFAGDLFGAEAFLGATNRLFDAPGLWTKLAENNHYPAGSRKALEQLVHMLGTSPSEASQRRLSELLDMPAWGRFGAFELLTQSTACDEQHNWRLYWDPWRLRLEPVVWNPSAWASSNRPAADAPIAYDIVPSRLQQWLCTNGDFLAARQQALQQFLAHGGRRRFDAKVAQSIAQARAALAHDPDIWPVQGDSVDRALDELQEFYRRVMHDLSLAYTGSTAAVTWAHADADTLRFRIEGREPVTAVILRFSQPLAAAIPVSQQWTRFGTHQSVDLAAGVEWHDNELRVPARMFCQLEPELNTQGPSTTGRKRVERPGTYELRFTGLPRDNAILAATVVRGDHDERARQVDDVPAADAEFVFVPVRPQPLRRPLVWSGSVDLRGHTEIDSDVTIEPGTTIRLHKQATVVFHGRVTALGSEAKPIRFVPAANDQDPWGTVGLNGPGCNGSHFRWCEVIGGSGSKEALAEYTAMFSVHNCTDVRVEDCHFAENHTTDDMIHVIYSEVTFERVRLDSARMDALDCDISRVVVRDSVFAHCGNDGLDLMTTQAIVTDCRFEGCGDKGISIGEDSRTLAVRSVFDGCSKALEAKDRSVGVAVNCEMRHNQKALSAYRKNWRYDAGGTLLVHKSILVDNQELATADPWSHAEIIDCQFTGEIGSDYEQEYVDGHSKRIANTARLTESDRGLPPRRIANPPFPAELQAMEGAGAAAWQAVRGAVRGVPHDR